MKTLSMNEVGETNAVSDTVVSLVAHPCLFQTVIKGEWNPRNHILCIQIGGNVGKTSDD
jgi:hypothetical protein